MNQKCTRFQTKKDSTKLWSAQPGWNTTSRSGTVDNLMDMMLHCDCHSLSLTNLYYSRLVSIAIAMHWSCSRLPTKSQGSQHTLTKCQNASQGGRQTLARFLEREGSKSFQTGFKIYFFGTARYLRWTGLQTFHILKLTHTTQSVRFLSREELWLWRVDKLKQRFQDPSVAQRHISCDFPTGFANAPKNVKTFWVSWKSVLSHVARIVIATELLLKSAHLIYIAFNFSWNASFLFLSKQWELKHGKNTEPTENAK